MKIASSALEMGSSHLKQQQHEIKESLRSWVGNQRPDFEGQQRRRLPAPETVQISDAGKSAQSGGASAIDDAVDAANNDPMLRLIRAMVAMLTGKEVAVFDSRELPTDISAPDVQASAPSNASSQQAAPQQAAGFGIEYERHESYTETEQTNFAATGIIKTADGREINFSLSLSMSRSYHEESNVSIQQGDARKKQDPLVINFGGNAAQLTEQRFKFDLNSDGQAEDINFVTGGSGFLALDRNGDGKINNGTELFGANTGNGFSELAALDADSNGWIDENDAAFNQLKVWTKDASGKDQLATLKQANVGALNLAHLATPFDIKDGSNALQATVRSSGIYLSEDGHAGTLQQIDLTV